MKVTINGWPVTTRFGAIDADHALPHKGIDFGAPMGAPIPSVADGTITAITDEGNRSFGLAIHMRTTDGSDVIYGHLSGVNVTVGQRVHANQIIGYVGSSGDSTGPHLHLQTMINGAAVDPGRYLQPKSFSMLDTIRDAHENGIFHAITGETTQQFAVNVLHAVSVVAMDAFLIALSIALFGFKFARKWAIVFVGAYFVLIIIERSMLIS